MFCIGIGGLKSPFLLSDSRVQVSNGTFLTHREEVYLGATGINNRMIVTIIDDEIEMKTYRVHFGRRYVLTVEDEQFYLHEC